MDAGAGRRDNLREAGFVGDDEQIEGFAAQGDAGAASIFAGLAGKTVSEGAHIVHSRGAQPIGSLPMSEVIHVEDDISKLLRETIWAVQYWPGGAMFASDELKNLWRYRGGGMMVFTRWYGKSRVLLDKFQKLDKNVLATIAEKSAAVERYNEKNPSSRIGYLPMTIDTTLTVDDIAKAAAGNVIELRAAKTALMAAGLA